MVVGVVGDLSHQTGVHKFELPTPFRVGPVNSYLLETEQHKVLVDTGINYPPAREALESGLRSIGLSPMDVDAVVLTHGHIDHVGLTSHFQKNGAKVYAHPDVGTWLEPYGPWDTYREDFFRELYRICGMDEEAIGRGLEDIFSLRQWNDQSVVDVVLKNQQPFPLIPEWNVIYVPGHAQAAIALYHAGTGEIIIGDQLLPHISSNALVEPRLDAARGKDAKRTKSLVDYRQNLLGLQRLDIKKVYPGHGNIFSDAHELIENRLAEQDQRLDKFIDLLRNHGPQTVYQLALRYFPRHTDQTSLIVSETLGYLDFGVEQNRVHCATDKDGVLKWSV